MISNLIRATKFAAALLLTLTLSSAYSWNAIGHQIVAQIAYDNLKPTVKRRCDFYNRALNDKDGFVKSAVWMDKIKTLNKHQYDNLHYIDIPFSPDKMPLPPVAKENAMQAIYKSMAILTLPSTDIDKGLALRMLTHIIGDIHQPLHTVTRVTEKYPEGDRGGNLFVLKGNPNNKNLHQYWDNGAGLFLHKKQGYIKRKAHQLEKKWPCSKVVNEITPQIWIEQSNKLALNKVYTLPAYSKPNVTYNRMAKRIIEKQIAFAGCRLANTLNQTLIT